MVVGLPAQALPTLLTSRPRPLLDCKVPCDTRSPAKGLHALPEAYPSSFRVRNTFIDTSAQRSPSLEAVFRERDVSTCPASHAGRLRGLFREASAAGEADVEASVRQVQRSPVRSSQACQAGDATPDGADEPRLHPCVAPVARLRLAEMLDMPAPSAALSTLQSPTNVGLPVGYYEMQHEQAWNSQVACCNGEFSKLLPQADVPSAHGVLGSSVLDQSATIPGKELGCPWSQARVAGSGADAVNHDQMAVGVQQPTFAPAGTDAGLPPAPPARPDLLFEAQQGQLVTSLQGLNVGPALRMLVDPGCAVALPLQQGRGGGSDARMLAAAGHAVPLAPGLVTTPPAPPSQPAPGSPELPSVGSAGHASGQCKPCAFVHSTGCQHGPACQFCHLCEPGEKKRRRKEKLERLRAARKLRNATE